MNNKTNIEEDINICKAIAKNMKYESTFNLNILKLNKNNKIAIESILTNRERLLEDKEILEDNYQILSESVSGIAKELGLQEDATIDEIYTAIRILKSKRHK